MWKNNFWDRFIVILNFVIIFVFKGINLLGPLILAKTINAIVCDSSKGKCPSTYETYFLIGLYSAFKLSYDLLNNFREIPYANMAATAEIQISKEVYEHVQSLSLSYHLSRETGKIIRIVSRGSQSFQSILRMLIFQFSPIIVEVTMTLTLFFWYFSWKFFVI